MTTGRHDPSNPNHMSRAQQSAMHKLAMLGPSRISMTTSDALVARGYVTQERGGLSKLTDAGRLWYKRRG